MTLAAGIDVGTGAVKAVIFDVDDDGNEKWLARSMKRIRQYTLSLHDALPIDRKSVV